MHLKVDKSPGIGVMMSYESTSRSVAPSMVHEEVVIICKSQLQVISPLSWDLQMITTYDLQLCLCCACMVWGSNARLWFKSS